jgi:hypothetical protein
LAFINENDLDKIIDAEGKPLDKSVVIRGLCLQSACMGSIPKHPFLQDCMNWYADKHFLFPDGSTMAEKIIAPDVYAQVAVDYGFRYRDVHQNLKNNIIIYPSKYFAGSRYEITRESYGIHYCAGSWRDRKNTTLIYRIKRKIKQIFSYIRHILKIK